MRIARSLDEIGDISSAMATRTVLTIGNFDGVHRGHQRLLTQLVHRASELGAVPAALTFEPHPLKIVAPQFAPKLILTLDTKARWMEELGIELFTVLPFTEQMAHLSPEAFIKQVVVERLRPREVHVGPSFRFGHRQRGDTALLSELAQRFGFGVEIMPMLEMRGHTVSSTRIRELVASGHLSTAGRLLGRPFRLHGPLIRGRGIGREQTVPTLNLDPQEYLLPKDGVYVTRTYLRPAPPDSGPDHPGYESVTNVGHRPTFGDHPLSVESYLLDFSGEQKATEIETEFLYRLRDEIKFPSPVDLKRQIETDVGRARRFFQLLRRLQTHSDRRLSPTASSTTR